MDWTRRVAVWAMICATTLALAGCGGSSATPTPNPIPSISAITPANAIAGGAAFTLTVNGSGFLQNSTVELNGSPRTTTFVSATELNAAITAADVAAAGTTMVTVSTPAPGGGVSGALSFTIDNPAPIISSLGPSSAFAGNPGFLLTVTGTNFVASSTVQWNGSMRATTFVSNTSLQVTISAADIANAGMAAVTIVNPAPGGGTSTTLNFQIRIPSPQITSLNPSSAVMGGSSFTLTITGKNFSPSSSVQWKGRARTTVFLSTTSLQASINSSDIAGAGTVDVTVSNDPAGGAVSEASTFFVGTSGGANFAVITIDQAAQDVVYDPVNKVFYLSVTSTAATHPNTISVFDPAIAMLTSSQAAGTNPNILAISDDSQFLYAGIDGSSSVQRFTLPGLKADINYPLPPGPPGENPSFAVDLRVAPGLPHTTAVSIGAIGGPTAREGITIFDDATARPTNAPGFLNGGGIYDSIAWTSDGTEILAANFESSSYDFYTLSVGSGGVALSQDYSGVFSGSVNRIQYDAGTKLLYADEGHVVNPATGLPVGNFNIDGPGAIVPDSSLNAAFFVTTGSGSSVTIQSFDLTHFTPTGSITIPNVTGSPIHLIRWGKNGLAFNTGGSGVNGQTYLVGGDFISPAPPFALTAPPTPAPFPTPATNAPKILSMNPSSAIAGAQGFPLVVTGTNFDAAATVQFNGTALATTFISSTTLQATIAPSNLSTLGTLSVTVANPVASGGISDPSTFFVGSASGKSPLGASFAVAAVSQPSKDIVYDPVHREIFLSVPEGNASGNTISVLDLATATIAGSQFVGSNPNVLAISDDCKFLYAALDGSSSVQRLTLPRLGLDISYSLGTAGFLGPQFALDLGVAPGAPNTSAVTLGVFNVSPNAEGVMRVFDDATARGTSANIIFLDHLSWGADADTLFATAEFESELFVLTATPGGVVVSQTLAVEVGDARLHFDAGTKLVYSDDGHAVDPSTGTVAGNFNTSGLMVPDSTLNRAFFLTRTSGPPGAPSVTITSFDLKLFTQIDSITINNVTGVPQRLIRWGQNGLAFNTDAGQVFLVGGNFVH